MATLYQQWHVVLTWMEPDGFETTGACMPFVPVEIGQPGAIDRACQSLAVDLVKCTARATAVGAPCEKPSGAA